MPTSFEESKPTLACSQNIFFFFSKNARIHSTDRLAELAAELYNVDWDVVLFSQTRSARERCVLEGGHVLYTSETVTQAAGVAILLHKKHVHRVGQVTSLNERLMFLDLHCGRRCVRFISLYMPHAGYSIEALRSVYDMLHAVLDEAERLQYKTIVGGDFFSAHLWRFHCRIACRASRSFS